ncbi:MAG: hypothetical protein QOD32_2921 [Pyrinomonadaceae bacterium]|jgi:hypothetical protein|nr:hypothetical protein [Pyrinomonadaceae bacterium]
MSRPSPPRNDRFEDYVPVAERLERFYERFPDGRVITHIIEHNSESGFVLMRAEVYRSPDDAQPAATGHAFEVRGESYVNKTSYIENCETGAVGRALALLGFEVKRGIASREELEKTSRMTTDRAARASNAAPQAAASTPAANTPAASAPAATANVPADQGVNLDAEILQSAGALGYDAAKVRKWIDQKFKVTGGLDALGADDKREVLRVFREKASPAAKGTAK